MHRFRRIFAALVVAIPLGFPPSEASARWAEEDFAGRVPTPLSFRIDESGAGIESVVGAPRSYSIRPRDTLWDIARHLGLGIEELRRAYPDLDLWVPSPGTRIEAPTWYVLPRSERRGVIVNIPEMRLYYFGMEPGRLLTFPVGLGREDWQTPVGEFHITEKTVDPTWVIPEGILEERARLKNLHNTHIPGGDPSNPLGRYRMRLSLPLYGIHGTNIPWGVGMRVSHGCVRMYPEDIDALFPLVDVRESGAFLYQPVKFGERGGEVYVEVHGDIYDTGFDFWNESMLLLAERGWTDRIDQSALLRALDEATGIPVAITRSPAERTHSP